MDADDNGLMFLVNDILNLEIGITELMINIGILYAKDTDPQKLRFIDERFIEENLYAMKIVQMPHRLGWLSVNKNITYLHQLLGTHKYAYLEDSGDGLYQSVSAFDESARCIILHPMNNTFNGQGAQQPSGLRRCICERK